MLRLSLASLGIASIIGIVGLSGLADFTWIDVRKTLFAFLLIPVFILLLVAFRKSVRF